MSLWSPWWNQMEGRCVFSRPLAILDTRLMILTCDLIKWALGELALTSAQQKATLEMICLLCSSDMPLFLPFNRENLVVK